MEKFKEICKNMFKAFLKVEYKLLLAWCTVLTLWLFFTMMSVHIYKSVCDNQEKQMDSLQKQIEKLEYHISNQKQPNYIIIKDTTFVK